MRKAFTLVELLVVIAIIALMLCVLVPSLSRVREYLHIVRCQANQHMLNQALAQYAATYSLSLPHSNWGTRDSIGKGWLYDQRALTGQYGPKDLQSGSLWMYVGNAEAYRCPLDPGPYDNTCTHAMTSYMANSSWGGHGQESGYPQFRYPRFDGGCVTFLEPVGEQRWLWNDGANYPNDPIAKRHRNGSVVGCFDGHAEWLSSQQYAALESRRPGRLWCWPGSADGM